MRVERVSDDGLSRDVWDFYVGVNNHRSMVNVAINYYAREKRPSKRHKFSPEQFYSYSARRASMDAALVPLPDDVIAEVKSLIAVAVYPATADRRWLFS